MLILVFNFPNYNIIPLLEIIYRPAFKNIAYCGFRENNTNMFLLLNKFKQQGLSIFTYEKPDLVTPGGFSLSEICPTLVMKEYQNVQVWFFLYNFVYPKFHLTFFS